MLRVSDDVWADHLAPLLGQRDLASLAACCADLRATMDRVRCRRGIRVRHERVDILADPRWATLARVDVRGMPWRYVTRLLPPLRLDCVVGLVHLRALHLHHPRMPPDPVWPTVFAACPGLREVKVVGDFYMHNYAQDVGHCTDLVVHGAPRLERLDLEGGWLVIFPRGMTSEAPGIQAAIRRMRDTPPVVSGTLRSFRTACKQVPIGVDAPLQCLEIDDTAYPPLAIERMGPVTRAATECVTWKTSWPHCDARHLAGFTGLSSADIHLGFMSRAARASEALRSLAHLPRTLRRVTLRLDLWLMAPEDSEVEWGAPLAHLQRLEDLDVEVTFPPLTVAELVAGWMGAGGAALRRVRARFQATAAAPLEREFDRLAEDGACLEDETMVELLDGMARVSGRVDPGPLTAWLDRHPGATAVIKGLHDRLECDHPRCSTDYA